MKGGVCTGMMEQMINTLDTWHASDELIHPLTAATTTTDTATPTSSPWMKKPRKSRASKKKKKPTTVLNANPNNFRALVQQLTGRPRPSAAAAVFGPPRGPINLSFSNYQYAPPPPPPPLQLQHEYSHHQGLISSTEVFSSFFDDEGFSH